jgi:hypothetical protein
MERKPFDDWGLTEWEEIGYEAYLLECNACDNFSSGYVRKDITVSWGKICGNCRSDDIYIVRGDG